MSRSSASKSPAGRRRFLKLVGLAGISSAVNASMASWAQTRNPKAGKEPAALADSAATAQPPEVSDEARALAKIVERRYGQHLDPEQLEGVAREIENRLRGGKRLREAKLANHDEPDFVFRA